MSDQDEAGVAGPARSGPVPFYRHGLIPDDATRIAAVLATPFLTSGGVGRRVEEQLCAYFDVAHAKLTNSWTNGAIAVLMALDIGPGDEVIVPAMTFIATANVVELVGATPIFVDVDPATLLIDIAAVRKAITEKTRAVMPVHLYGQMVNMAALRAAVGPDVALIEDCAHAFESRLNGERPGAHSDAAVFSFYATKNVTCGEGGAVISRDARLMERLRQTVLHGMSVGADRRFEGALYRHWEMERLGTKANLPDLLAALLPAQIETVESRREMRAALAHRYDEAFRANGSIRLVHEVAGGVSGHHLYALGVLPGRRDQVLHDLNEAGVGATVNYRAVHTMGFYSRTYQIAPERFPHSLDWGQRTLSVPLFPGLRADEQDRVIATLLDAVRRLADCDGIAAE